MRGELAPAKQADHTGGASLPAVAGTIYGIAYLVEHWQQSKFLPALLIVGGLASLVLVQTTIWVFFSPPGRNWRSFLAALSSLVPYFYSLLLMGYLGLRRLWIDVSDFRGLWPVLAALFWILAGWRMLFVLGRIVRKDAG